MSEYFVRNPSKPFRRVECALMRAYITGLFDTRLNFIIWDGRKRGKGWGCRASFITTDSREIDFLHEQFQAGAATDKANKRPDNWRQTSPNAKVFCCTWSAGGLLLDHIIEIMEPYARFSVSFLALMKEFRSLTRDIPRINGMTPPDIVQKRDEVYSRFCSIDRKYLKKISTKHKEAIT